MKNDRTNGSNAQNIGIGTGEHERGTYLCVHDDAADLQDNHAILQYTRTGYESRWHYIYILLDLNAQGLLVHGYSECLKRTCRMHIAVRRHRHVQLCIWRTFVRMIFKFRAHMENCSAVTMDRPRVIENKILLSTNDVDDDNMRNLVGETR